MASPTINTLTSFSGADLVVSFANQVIGELQSISWSIQREKAPVFTLGSADARSFSRGKRGIAGNMDFAVFDQDSLVEGMKRVWDQIAPPAMFTATGNLTLANTENFITALDMLKWNVTTQEGIEGKNDNLLGQFLGKTQKGTHEGNYGFSGDSKIGANVFPGSNTKPVLGKDEFNKYNVVGWEDSNNDIRVPAGFSPIRGGNVLYADTLPPFDITLTFGNEYGQCAFQKIYDADIMNESSGVSVDTIVLARQMTYLARRISPMIRGVYSRESGGTVKGQPVVAK